MRITASLLFLMACSTASPNEESSCYVDRNVEIHAPVQSIQFCHATQVPPRKVMPDFEWWAELNPQYPVPEWTWDNCEEPTPLYVIRINMTDPAMLEKLNAIAYTYVDSHVSWVEGSEASHTTWAWSSSDIYIRPSNNHSTIRHEIGHAYGYDHVSWSGHLLSESGSGRDTCGLETF